MKIYVLPLALTALMLLSACSDEKQMDGSPHMTQTIISGDVVQPEDPQEEEGSETASDSSSSAQAAKNAAPSPESTLSNYYKIKAEKAAYGLEIAQLEADFRVGKLDQKSFTDQKAALIEKVLECDREEDRLEATLLPFTPDKELANTKDASAISKLRQAAELAEKEAELFQEKLKNQYNNEITSWDKETHAKFVEEYAALVRQAEEADAQADWLEDRLEHLGWDDDDDDDDLDDDFDDDMDDEDDQDDEDDYDDDDDDDEDEDDD